MKDQYKPILVFYLKNRSDEENEFIISSLKRIHEESGYSIITMHTEREERVELLSVDKATVVEDIQKYIDLKFGK